MHVTAAMLADELEGCTVLGNAGTAVDRACLRASYADGAILVIRADMLGELPSPHPACMAFACGNPEGVVQTESALAGALREGCTALLAPLALEDLVDAVQRAIAKLQAWDMRLLEAMAQNYSMGQVLQIGGEMLSNPVALTDSSAAIIAWAGELPRELGSTIWAHIIARGFAPMSFYTADELRMLQAAPSEHPIRYRPMRDRDHEYATVALLVAGRFYGALSQVSISAPFTQGQMDLLAHLRDRMQQMAAIEDASSSAGGSINRYVHLLFDGRNVEQGAVSFHLTERVWQMDDAYLVAVVPLPEGHEGEAPSEAFLAQVAKAAPAGIALMHNKAVVLILRGEGDHDDAAWTGLAKIAREHGIIVGVGMDVPGFMDIRASYLQALGAIAAANPQDVGSIVDYRAVIRPRMAQLVGSQDGLLEVVHPRVQVLARRSGEQWRENLQLVETFLACGGNASRAAKMLYMNRTTLLYHLDKIEELLGLELDNLTSGEAEHLMLSCVLLLAAR